jgi:hypothetical protein
MVGGTCCERSFCKFRSPDRGESFEQCVWTARAQVGSKRNGPFRVAPREFGSQKQSTVSPVEAQGQGMFKTFGYYWNATRGYRWKPWKSPYMRWRFETFLGKEAVDLTARKLFQLAWKYREDLERFVDWASERRRIQHRHHT